MQERYIHWKWLKIIEPVIDECKKIAYETDMEKYAKAPFNIDPDMCFFPYLSFTTCIYAKGFKNCHGDMWLKTKNCQKWMTFFNTCDSLDTTPKLINIINFLNL
uniref:CSON007296 protein n=1 Tax=Culicoides sonorensis TaxID=179676 RepID=A0A336MTZ1_CULSO